jgi:alpha-tubulin suppressor-like RCC1 family protein
MSLRYTGAWLQNGAFNPLTAPTPSYTLGLWSWGANPNGALGLGNTTNISSPTQIGSLTNWLPITTIGWYSSQNLAVKNDGTLWSWGSNSFGTLGLGNTTNYSSPKQVGALTTWLQVSNAYHTLAVKTDGTLWAWGRNNVGQLGLGNITNYSSPKQVGALTTWLQALAIYVSSQSGSSLAIKTDGTLWSWGKNQAGQLGLGNITYYSSPKQIGLLTNWSKISFSGISGTALVIKTDGTLWSWGSNTYGQLGLGNTTGYSSPKQVGLLTTWLQVSSSYTGYGIKTDGTLWSWGRNNYGQLGFGNTTDYSSPKQVGSLTTWLNVAAGGYHALVVKTNGTLWSWGYNASGQLGLGNTTNYSSPKQVGSLTTWTQASGKGYSSFATQY